MLTGHSKAVIAVNSVLPFVAAFTIALRLYAKRLKALRFMASDYVILVALVMRVSLVKASFVDIMQAVTVAHSMAYIYCIS